MKYNVLIHYQFMPDDGKILREKILPLEDKTSASLVPGLFDKSLTFPSGREICPDVHPHNNFYSKESKQLFKNFKQSRIGIFVEGYLHCCKHCFLKGKDPYHEFVCADRKTAQSLETQVKNINKGALIVESETGVYSPDGIAAPNHQWNNNTKVATEKNGLKYFVVRNPLADYAKKIHFPLKISLPAWKEDGMIILPESKIPGKAPLLYVMYSDVVDKGWEKYEKVFENAVPLEELKIENQKPRFADLSEKIFYWGKQKRDRKR